MTKSFVVLSRTDVKLYTTIFVIWVRVTNPMKLVKIVV